MEFERPSASGRLVLRMAAPAILTSVLLLILGVTAAWYVQRLQKRTSNVLAENVASVRAAEEFEIGIREVRTRLTWFEVTGDPKYLEAVPALRRDTDHWLRETRRLAMTPHEQELVARVDQGYAYFFREFDRLSDQEPSEILAGEVLGLIELVLTNEILQPAHEYLDVKEEEAARASRENQIMAERLVIGLSALGLCGAAAGLIAGFGIARSVSRSLVQLSIPIHDAAGKLNQVVGPVIFSADLNINGLGVTLRSVAEHVGTVIRQLRESQREILRSEQLAALGRLAACAAHELRNPLTAVKMLVQLNREAADKACLPAEHLVVIEQELCRMERCLQSFLNFARPPRPERRPLDLAPLVSRAFALVAGRARQQRVDLRFAPPADPTVVHADDEQVLQLLINLFLNALDAMPQGGTLEVQLHPPADDPVELCVLDTGPGVPADLLPRLFEPFVSTKETGLGLGLVNARRIAESHCGSLQAANRPQGGACFTLRLPALESGAAAPGEA